MTTGIATDLQSVLDKWQEMQKTWSETWGQLQGYVDRSNGVLEALGMKLVILDKGFVYVGDLTLSGDGRWCYLDNTWSVRHWGTTRGLGQLRLGPTKKTIIDPCGRIQIPFGNLQHFFDINEDKWLEKFDATMAEIAAEKGE